MSGFLKRVAEQRLAGERPAPARAVIAGAALGAAAAGVTYRLLAAVTTLHGWFGSVQLSSPNMSSPREGRERRWR
jgi:hypothetical protein